MIVEDDGVTVTEAEALFVGSATLVAVTVTVVLTLTVGAANSPELEIDPAVPTRSPPCSCFRSPSA